MSDPTIRERADEQRTSQSPPPPPVRSPHVCAPEVEWGAPALPQRIDGRMPYAFLGVMLASLVPILAMAIRNPKEFGSDALLGSTLSVLLLPAILISMMIAIVLRKARRPRWPLLWIAAGAAAGIAMGLVMKMSRS